jgi:hypothetical protein
MERERKQERETHQQYLLQTLTSKKERLLVVVLFLLLVITHQYNCLVMNFCEPIAVSDEHSMQTGGFRRVAIATRVVQVNPERR